MRIPFSLLRATVALLFLLVITSAAFADEVRVKNGDRYTGTIVSLDRGVLKVDTGHGTLDLPWADVTSIVTAMPMIVTVAGQPAETVTLQLAPMSPKPGGGVLSR